ncbi:hypothetical protein [Streptomyces sp. NPDC093594]|uniref:hypothetical protein n=1 Tax=Streptomyces sp. NPDC093594 TaxID=3155305 RepID=UPI0034505946
MSMTRRGYLKGIIVAPVAASIGPVFGAARAEATTIDAGQFRLEFRASNTYGDFSSLNAGLATKLPTITADRVIANTNRDAKRLLGAPSAVGAFQAGFAWDGGDQAVPYWIPQGITTSADSYSNGLYPVAGSNRIVAVSWYFESDPDGDGVDEYSLDKGMRLSLVNYNNPAVPTYRHILLVEPIMTSSGDYSFKPVRRHAGGIAWYGNLLYVVDTKQGFRIFDLNQIFQVSTTESEICGRHDDGSYHGYGYEYVLPQSGAYDNRGTVLRFSTMGLDRASTPDSLVISEYSKAGTVVYDDGDYSGNHDTAIYTPKIVRWDLNYTNRLLASHVATEAVTVRQQKIQGVVSRGSRHYLSVSSGPSMGGTLRTLTSASSAADFVCNLSVGCEDLSYHPSTTSGWTFGESVIWNISEYANERYVYAVRADGS